MFHFGGLLNLVNYFIKSLACHAHFKDHIVAVGVVANVSNVGNVMAVPESVVSIIDIFRLIAEGSIRVS